MIKEEIIRGEIVDSASRLFQQFGFHKTTMEDIAKAARKGKSTLYYYFTNKDEVFEAVVTKEIYEVQEAVIQAVEKGNSAKEKLKIYTATNFIELRKKVILFKMVYGEMQVNITRIMYKMRSLFDSNEVELLKGLLLYGIKSGEFTAIKEEDVDLLAHTFISAFRGIEVDLFVENKLAGLEERIDMASGILIRGMI
jgi:AcrR family transcriptional regulator